MEIWSNEEECRRLATRFEGVKQAAFARDHKVPGGASMLSQHIKGRRPLNLASATAYAKGFGVQLVDISPRLAAEVDLANRQQHSNDREDGNVEPGPEFKGLRDYPLISWVEAGEWSDLCDNYPPGEGERRIASHHNLGECGFILKVSGHSMTAPAGSQYSFPEGILLYVNPQKEANVGQFVIVRREKEKTATFKKLVSIDGELFLEAINPDWPRRYLKLEEGDEICGVVVDASFGNLP